MRTSRTRRSPSNRSLSSPLLRRLADLADAAGVAPPLVSTSAKSSAAAALTPGEALRDEPAAPAPNEWKLRVTPAMAAGVSDRLWENGDIVKMVEKAEGPAKKRGPYKKRAA